MTDPTRLFAQWRSSFDQPPLEFSPELLPTSFRLPSNIFLTSPQVQINTATEAPLPRYVNLQKLEALEELKARFVHPQFETIRDALNPFGTINSSIFHTRAGIKLANLDALYNFTYHFTGTLEYTSSTPLSFCDLAGGPGSFTRYLQWRLPLALGHGITLRGASDWDGNIVNLQRFRTYYGPDNSGNLLRHWEGFVNFVRANNPAGVDIVVADGAIDVGSQYNGQEWLNSPLILAELAASLQLLAPGGWLICKLFATHTLPTAQMLFVVAHCFEEIALIKPASSRPANDERYLVARNFIPNDPWAGVLRAAAKAEHPTAQFLSQDLPSEFEEWLTNVNNELLDLQYDMAENIVEALEKGIPKPTIPAINPLKTLAVWNLPE